MARDARRMTLLYVSDWFGGDSGDVKVYDYRSRYQVGELIGFNGPYGECVDKSGDVYIADFNAQIIEEFAHGGTSPIKSLWDAYGYPIGCSIDPTTGNLAVANFASVNPLEYGGILVYLGATGQPIQYQTQALDEFWSPGYDENGDLFVEGRSESGVPGMAELSRGGHKLASIKLKETIHYPGGVMWDGKYVTATDQEYEGQELTAVYQLEIRGMSARVIGTTVLAQNCGGGSYSDVPQPFIVTDGKTQGRTLVGGNYNCLYTVGYWAYPAGGDPAKTLHDPPGYPIGQAVSDAP